jgi:adenylate kinase
VASARSMSAPATLNRALIFLGPPGAGKGTQAKLVAQYYGVPHLSTGDMLRDQIRRGTEQGRLAKPIMERGELVPDNIVLGMVEERIQEPDCVHGLILDGFPRTVPQAEGLDRILQRLQFGYPLVFYIAVDPEKLMRRLTGRRTCSTGGEIYNIYDKPPKAEGRCDNDGGVLVQRPDDKPEVIRERIVAYEAQTKPLVDYYRRQGTLREVDGSADAESVNRAVFGILERL